MVTLQDDILSIYNQLVMFSKTTLEGTPIRVNYDSKIKTLVFTQLGKNAYLQLPNYYSTELTDIKDTFLMPDDYNYMMSSLSNCINSGKLLDDRTCLAPKPYGFDIYSLELSKIEAGPRIIGSIRFVTSVNPIWSWWKRIKYKNVV